MLARSDLSSYLTYRAVELTERGEKTVQTTLGDRIRGKRNERRMTQVELARRAGLNPKTIGYIEGGKSSGMYDSISRIAAALGVSFDYLEKGHGE